MSYNCDVILRATTFCFHSTISRSTAGETELHARGAIVPVEPQVFDLLVYLIENRDRVVSKDDLIASVWNGRVVSDSTLDSRINAVRKALGDSGGRQQFVRTIVRKGFRFVGDVKTRRHLGRPLRHHRRR